MFGSELRQMEETGQTRLHEHCAQVVTIMPTKVKPPTLQKTWIESTSWTKGFNNRYALRNIFDKRSNILTI